MWRGRYKWPDEIYSRARNGPPPPPPPPQPPPQLPAVMILVVHRLRLYRRSGLTVPTSHLATLYAPRVGTEVTITLTWPTWPRST